MLLRNIQAESPALDLLMILLWLFCAGITGQEPCSSPGDFPSPKLFLNTSSAQEGDSILAQCSLHPNIVAALVIFCQDGKEISSQEAMAGRLLYQHDISVRSSGQFRCMYQYRNNQNQVKNSRLSLPRTLDLPDRSIYSSDTDHSSSDSSEKKSVPYGPAMSVYIWILRCTLVLLLLVSAPIITNVLERTSHRSS